MKKIKVLNLQMYYVVQIKKYGGNVQRDMNGNLVYIVELEEMDAHTARVEDF